MDGGIQLLIVCCFVGASTDTKEAWYLAGEAVPL